MCKHFAHSVIFLWGSYRCKKRVFSLRVTIYDAALLKYAMHPWTHIDFLIYSKVSKLPILAIEIDGWHFHSAKNMKAKMQAERDKMKDEILRLCKIPLQRLTTNGSEEIRKIREKLKQF